MKITTALILLVVVVGCVFTLTACNNPTLDKDYSFAFSIAETTIWEIPNIPMFFTEDSGLEITKDGELTINIMLSSSVSLLLSTLDFDLSAISELDLDELANTYGIPYLPWFDIKDIKTSLEKLKESLGGEIVLDYEEEATQKLIASIEETGHANEDFTIPKTFGLRYTGTYKVKHLVSEVTGKEYTALYVDKYTEGGEPFFIITLDENEEGLKTANLRVEFLKLDFNFVERAQN